MERRKRESDESRTFADVPLERGSLGAAPALSSVSLPGARPSTGEQAQLSWRTVDPTESKEWNNIIDLHPESTVFHRSEWARVLKSSYRHKPCYLVGERVPKPPAGEAQPPGVLALMELDTAWTGRRGVGLPFTDACAPLTGGHATGGGLLGAALELGRERGWRTLEIRGVTELLLPPSLRYAGHVLGLGTEGSVVAGFRPSVRQSLRKAAREGVQCSTGTGSAEVEAFYGLHRLTRRRHGVPPQPFEFFENILAGLLSKGLGFITVARWRGKPVAGAVFLCHGAKAVFKYGASDFGLQNLRGSTLVMAEGIRWLCRNGFGELDLGRSSVRNQGLRRFKRGFGAREHQIDYLKYDFRQRSFVTARDRAMGWVPFVFGWMPLPLSELVGRLVYRHLS